MSNRVRSHTEAYGTRVQIVLLPRVQSDPEFVSHTSVATYLQAQRRHPRYLKVPVIVVMEEEFADERMAR